MNYTAIEQNNPSSSPQICKRGLGIVFSILCVCLSAAQAKDHKATSSSAAIKIVTSMAFDENKPTDMSIQQAGGKSYLYIQLANDAGVAVVDVTKPDKPKVVSSMSSFKGASHFQVSGNAATISAEQSDILAKSANPHELLLWDVSDPKNPRMVQRFNDVLRVLQDDRHYTYILNQDRLWVVKDRQTGTDNDKWDPSLYG